VNEQPQGYWLDKFAKHGWVFDEPATAELVRRFEPLQHCWWLKYNAIILRPEGAS
jgi:hypothetical protein